MKPPLLLPARPRTPRAGPHSGAGTRPGDSRYTEAVKSCPECARSIALRVARRSTPLPSTYGNVKGNPSAGIQTASTASSLSLLRIVVRLVSGIVQHLP
ncbi:MAG: hypothetical protein ABI837_19875 [Acidobacteriota bacterium]